MVIPSYWKAICWGRFACFVLSYSLNLILSSLPVCCRCLVVLLLSFSTAPSSFPLHISSLLSNSSLSSSLITTSSASSIAHGVSSHVSSLITFIIIMNTSGLSAEPWCSLTSISISSVSPTLACVVQSLYISLMISMYLWDLS